MVAKNLQHENPPSEILVFVDLPDGELDEAGKGILSEASRLANTLGCSWAALCFDAATDQAIEGFSPYGTTRVTLIEAPDGICDSLEAQGKLIALAASELEARLLLLPHNDLGGALAPILASAWKSALFTEAIAYSGDNDTLKLTRSFLGAQVAESKIWNSRNPLVLTINPRVLSAVVMPAMRHTQVQVERWQPSVPTAAGLTRIIQRIPPDPHTVDVSEAEVIISAGLGCNEKTFAQVEELTRLLNASLGVTRPVYDLGFAGFERMVGQTGKTVAPRLYLALGISGSMHHLGGIKDSRQVVSVNIDPKVPIFPNSDEGFVADLRDVLPLLIERVKAATGGGA
jgi:electron transfer flavoprotein alpha subunit